MQSNKEQAKIKKLENFEKIMKKIKKCVDKLKGHDIIRSYKRKVHIDQVTKEKSKKGRYGPPER